MDMQKLSALATAAFCLALSACTTTRTVEVPVPVNVPGPVQYVPIPPELLACEDTGDPPSVGQTLAELYGWARRTRAATVECEAKREEIRRLMDAAGK